VQVRALPARVRCPRPTPHTRGTAAAHGAAHGGGSRRLLPETHFLTPRSAPVTGLESAQLLAAGRGRRAPEGWQRGRAVLR
jgi:hypothetical protein